MIFTNDAVTSDDRSRIAARVTKIVIYGKAYIILFLTRLSMLWIGTSVKKSMIALFAAVGKDVFLT